jgi:hypothetical protein
VRNNQICYYARKKLKKIQKDENPEREAATGKSFSLKSRDIPSMNVLSRIESTVVPLYYKKRMA